MKFTKLALMLLLVQTMIFTGCSKDDCDSCNQEGDKKNPSSPSAAIINAKKSAEFLHCKNIHSFVLRYLAEHGSLPKSVDKVLTKNGGNLEVLPKSEFGAEFKIIPGKDNIFFIKGGKGVQYPPKK